MDEFELALFCFCYQLQLYIFIRNKKTEKKTNEQWPSFALKKLHMLIKIFIVIIRVCNDNKNKLFQYMNINQTPEKSMKKLYPLTN